MDSKEKLAISVPEAAELLGISKPTAYILVRRADFPAFKVGGRTLVSRTGLEAWVRKQEGAASEAVRN